MGSGSGPPPEPHPHSSTQLASKASEAPARLDVWGTDSCTHSLPASLCATKNTAAEKPSPRQGPRGNASPRGLGLSAPRASVHSAVVDTTALAPHAPLARAPEPVRWGSHTHKRQLGPTQDHLLPRGPGGGSTGENLHRARDSGGLTSGDVTCRKEDAHTQRRRACHHPSLPVARTL